MKKLLTLLCSLGMLLSLMACGSAASSTSAPATPAAPAANAQQLRVQDGAGHTVVFALNNSDAVASLTAQLPLEIKIENYSDNEKIFYPKKLNVSNTPKAAAGAGTLAYYAPWGDVVLFYGSYRPNSGLYELGQAVSGVDQISSLTGTVRIEVVKP